VPRRYREKILVEYYSYAMSVLDIENIEIEIIPYDGTPNLRNPFDRLTPEERRKKIVEIYAQIYLKMVRQKQQNNSNLNKK
jgi:hypothetical protein